MTLGFRMVGFGEGIY